MLALPLTPSTPQVHFDFDYASRHDFLTPNMGTTSYERASSPSVFTASTMSQGTRQIASPKRPKLSLQTSSLPITFGKSSTGLVIAASSVTPASPTLLNTFNNAYDMPHRFSPVTASPTGVRSARPSSRLVSPFNWGKDERPYQVPLGLKGILRNSPMPTGLRRSSLCPTGDSPRTSRRAFFPAPKRVTFRVVLDEEIKTTIYIAKHSDLPSDEEDSDSDDRSELSLSSSDESDAYEPSAADLKSQPNQQRKKRKAGSDRKIQAAAIRDCVGNGARVQNGLKPVFHTRSKRRRRQWEWTLEPLKKTSPQASSKALVGEPAPSAMKMPLSPSAGLNGDKALLSPSRIPLPLSATSAHADDSATPLTGSSGPLLPQPPQKLSPLSTTTNTKAEEEIITIGLDPFLMSRD